MSEPHILFFVMCICFDGSNRHPRSSHVWGVVFRWKFITKMYPHSWICLLNIVEHRWSNIICLWYEGGGGFKIKMFLTTSLSEKYVQRVHWLKINHKVYIIVIRTGLFMTDIVQGQKCQNTPCKYVCVIAFWIPCLKTMAAKHKLHH